MATLQSTAQFSETQRKRVQEHLHSLLESTPFAGSPRRQAFLRYVVEETLAGRGDAIKETNIAVDVFERSSDFDTHSDSIVRVTGGEVRKRLAQAYASGMRHDIQIELPVGSYHPFFHFLADRTAGAPQKLPVSPKLIRGRWMAIGFVAGLAVASILYYGRAAWTPKSSIDPIWQAFAKREQPVLISLTAPMLITVSDPQKWLPIRPGVSVPSTSLSEMDGAFVGSGGALGAALFGEQLTSRGHSFVIKFGNDLSFADLKNSPAILIGASRWTRELTQKLRFRMDVEANSFVIHDSHQPERSWSLTPGRRMDRSEGYSLVTWLIRSESGQPLLLVEGMDPRTTQAAVEFLSHGEKFDQLAATAPPGWKDKNFQAVLHSTIHGYSPGSLDVVASRFW